MEVSGQPYVSSDLSQKKVSQRLDWPWSRVCMEKRKKSLILTENGTSIHRTTSPLPGQHNIEDMSSFFTPKCHKVAFAIDVIRCCPWRYTWQMSEKHDSNRITVLGSDRHANSEKACRAGSRPCCWYRGVNKVCAVLKVAKEQLNMSDNCNSSLRGTEDVSDQWRVWIGM